MYGSVLSSYDRADDFFREGVSMSHDERWYILETIFLICWCAVVLLTGFGFMVYYFFMGKYVNLILTILVLFFCEPLYKISPRRLAVFHAFVENRTKK